MYIKLYNENPNPKQVKEVVDILERGGVIIYPTDTVYGIGCDITKPKAVERIARIKGMNAKKARFSFICYDISQIAEYTTPIDNQTFKLMKRNLPGPFTFILESGSKVPKILKSNRKHVGIRVPDNNIIREIVRDLGNPILTTSLKNDDEILEYTSDPELIYEDFQNLVDCVVDGGYGNNVPSTVIQCENGEYEVIRQGMGELR
ncbi:MAG: L-threonylcarbamoyladenylate synthase [Bacteroidales bacterium]|jgi:tRNA threonylcarbamoyl adenosine modification protein (Sua5/YciO/YrdC/YwlC family)|nr:L-threonylcarbamoyladenylate synthase [Bacteroidales bacterium]